MFVSVCITCTTVIPLAVMIGMMVRGDITKVLCAACIPSPQDWKFWLSSLLLSFRLIIYFLITFMYFFNDYLFFYTYFLYNTF